MKRFTYKIPANIIYEMLIDYSYITDNPAEINGILNDLDNFSKDQKQEVEVTIIYE